MWLKQEVKRDYFQLQLLVFADCWIEWVSKIKHTKNCTLIVWLCHAQYLILLLCVTSKPEDLCEDREGAGGG